MRKGQVVGQIFIYLLGIVLTGFLLLYGYKAIQGFKEKSNQAIFIKFKSDISSDIKIFSEFGTVKRKTYSLSEYFTEACFLDLTASQYDNIDQYPLIKNSLESGVQKNVFIASLDLEDSFYGGKIELGGGLLCIPIVNGKLNVQLEGKGDRTIISAYKI